MIEFLNLLTRFLGWVVIYLFVIFLVAVAIVRFKKSREIDNVLSGGWMPDANNIEPHKKNFFGEKDY